MIRWLGAGDGDPADYRLPVIIAAVFVLIPAAMVPVMGFGAIATSSHGAGWHVTAGVLAALGAIGVWRIRTGRWITVGMAEMAKNQAPEEAARTEAA